MTTDIEAWLRLTKETAIDAALPICDPHHHLWNNHGHRYLIEELLQDIGGGHNIEQTVFIECRSMYRKNGPPEMQPVGETEFVQNLTARSQSGQQGGTSIAAGIVGYADLTLGAAVAPVLEAQITAGKGRFRGIRNMSTWDASPEIRSYVNDPGLLMDAKFREGFACLKKYNLSFDAWLYHTQLPELVDLARAFPDTPIILDHIGGPLNIGPYTEQQEEVVKAWKQDITTLSAFPNVVVKLGGLGMPICGFHWHEQARPPSSIELAKAMSPYYLWCIEKFGAERCMFESNFPVDKTSYSYTVLWNAFKRICQDFSPDERSALFQGTAVRVYKLTTINNG